MRTRNLIVLILSLSILLAGGIAAAIFGGLLFGPDCRTFPDTPPCVIDEAAAIARQVEHPQVRLRLLIQSARAKLARLPSGSGGKGDLPRNSAALFDEAIEIANSFDDVEIRAMAMVGVASALTGAGYERGPEFFESAVQLVLEEGPGNSPAGMLMGPVSGPSETLAQIARIRAAAGDIAGARKTVARQSTQLWRAKTLAGIAETLAMQDDAAAASRFIDEALAVLRNLPDREAADTMASEAAGVLARTGRIDEALAMAAQPRDIEPRAFAHLYIVRALADAGRLVEAEEAFSRIEHSTARYQALWPLATARARAGDIAGAKVLLEDIKAPLARHQAIGDVAGFQAVSGDLEGALDEIADLPEGFARDRGLRIVLEKLIDAGRLDEAEEILAGFGNDALRGLLTLSMAGARTRAGQTDTALALARAAPDPATRAGALLAVAEAMQGTESKSGPHASR